MQLLARKIISIILIFTLFLQAPVANAIFSPTLSSEVSQIKSHVQEARRQNGVGNALSAAKKMGKVGLSASYYLYINAIKGLIFNSLGNAFLDGFSLLINVWIENKKFITNCLRDDIWELQALQEEVLNELFKAALLLDTENGDVLWEDYNTLEILLKGGKKTFKDKDKEVKIKGLKEDYTDTDLWFPGGQNYYVVCPYGEFKEAWRDLKLSFDRLISNFGEKSKIASGWGSLKEAAKKRAKARASKWIAANQFTFTLGGEDGSNPKSLLKGPGIDGFVADLKTEWEYVKEYGKMIGDSTWKEIADKWEYDTKIDKYVETYERAEKAKKLVLDQAEVGIQYNLRFNNVSEESLKSLETTMFQINKEIQRAYKADTSPDNLLIFCEQLRTVIAIQGKDKGSLPSCK